MISGQKRLSADSTLQYRIFCRLRPSVSFLLCLPLLLILTSCETLSSRLARNQETLQNLPQEHQDVIVEGKIKVGFTPVEVYLAWGAPDHKAITESTQGSTETWVYTQTQTDTYYRQHRVYNAHSDRWEYIDKPYQIQSKFVVKEAVFLDGRVDSFTLFPPSTRTYR